MQSQNQEIYTLDSGGQIKALLKQKVFSFVQNNSLRKAGKKSRVMSSSNSVNPQPPQNVQTINYALKPKLPSKKLFDQPRFFMSIERKNKRVISGLKDIAKFQLKDSILHNLRGKKFKYLQSQRKCSTPIINQSDLFSESVRTGWEPSGRTPYLNFNMQYLIKKRKGNRSQYSDRLGGPLQLDKKYEIMLSSRHP